MKKFYCMACGKYRCKAEATAAIKVIAEFGYENHIEAEAINTWVAGDEVAAGSFTCLVYGGPMITREGKMVFVENE